MKPHRPDWWARYPGGPYSFRGRDIATGIDCWGLVVTVLAHDFGRAVDDFGAVYEGRSSVRELIAAERPRWREVPWEEGAVALLREGGIPSHVGICTATPGLILHAHHSCGVDMLDIPRSLYWKGRLIACFLP